MWHALERKTRKISWQDLLRKDKRLRIEVKVSTSKSKLYHTTAVGERIKKYIYDCLGQNPSDFSEDTPKDECYDVNLQVNINHDQVEIYLAASTTPLHRRRYRLETGKAPLREDLAYSLLWNAGVRPYYFESHRRYEAVMDPFCGSGTIAIEAARMLRGIPPGSLLPAPFLGTTLQDDDLWGDLVSEMTTQYDEDGISFSVQASDRIKGAVLSTCANAKRAGVSNAIQTRTCAFSSHPWFEDCSSAPESVAIVSNLPFGKRTSVRKRPSNRVHVDPQLPLYQKLASNINRLCQEGDRICISSFLSNDRALLRSSGLHNPSKSMLTLSHGGGKVFASLKGATRFK